MEEQTRQPEKRTRLRGEERRALILCSARRVFARSTYAEASTGELARESGVTEPMLYKHFGSKKGLFLAVLAEFGGQFLAALSACIEHRAEADVLDALTHVVDDYCVTMKSDPETQRVLFQAVTEMSDPDIAACVGRHNRKVYGLIRQLVVRARDAGYLSAQVHLDAAAWGYMSMILAIQYGTMLNLSAEIAQVQDETSRIWSQGLLTQ